MAPSPYGSKDMGELIRRANRGEAFRVSSHLFLLRIGLAILVVEGIYIAIGHWFDSEGHRVRVLRNVPYLGSGHPAHLLDVYAPVADPEGLSTGGATHETQRCLELANGSRVVGLPGREATVRSFGGVALLVLDEAARIPDELYRSVRPMLAVSRGRLVALSTPFGQRGWFYQEWQSTGNANQAW